MEGFMVCRGAWVFTGDGVSVDVTECTELLQSDGQEEITLVQVTGFTASARKGRC